MIPVDAYRIYFRLKLHFTGKADFFEEYSNGFINRNWSRKSPGDRRVFSILVNRFKTEQSLTHCLLANMTARSPFLFVLELTDLDIHNAWVTRTQAMHWHWRRELEMLRDETGKLSDALRGDDTGQLPMLYRMLMTHKVSMETFAFLTDFQPKIIDVMDPFFDELDINWQTKKQIAQHYPGFLSRLNIDRERLKSILREVMS